MIRTTKAPDKEKSEPVLNLVDAANYLELRSIDILGLIAKNQLVSFRRDGILQFHFSELLKWKADFGSSHVSLSQRKEVAHG